MLVGDVLVDAISDGTFIARSSYFGEAVNPDARPDFFAHNAAAWLPIGCFLVRANERVVLVDAGLGPDLQELPDGMLLVGGQLLVGLNALGVDRRAITDVVCTHLHSDHVGWLFDEASVAVFPAATIWAGRADLAWVDHMPDEMAPHIRRGFDRYSPNMRLLDEDTRLTDEITIRQAQGHTPGSMIVEITSREARLLLLGDAITCPIQLDEPTWHSFGDVDPAEAQRVRQSLWKELSDGSTLGLGAHFPGLRAGSVDPERWIWRAA